MYSEIYGDMREKSYESQTTLATLEIMKFDLGRPVILI